MGFLLVTATGLAFAAVVAPKLGHQLVNMTLYKDLNMLSVFARELDSSIQACLYGGEVEKLLHSPGINATGGTTVVLVHGNASIKLLYPIPIQIPQSIPEGDVIVHVYRDTGCIVVEVIQTD